MNQDIIALPPGPEDARPRVKGDGLRLFKIQMMHQAGKNYSEIARVVKVSPQTIRKLLLNHPHMVEKEIVAELASTAISLPSGSSIRDTLEKAAREIIEMQAMLQYYFEKME